jgi:adenylate cyclase
LSPPENDSALPFISIILVTAKADTKDIVVGFDAVLRLKALHDRVLAQAADLASWNTTLEQRVLKSSASGV